MSQNLSGSGGSQQLDEGQQIEDESFNIYGMFFCGTCKNIMTPIKQLNEKLEFKCKLCDKKYVDFQNFEGDQCVIYNKQLKPGSKISKVDKQLAMDNTLPKVEIRCNQCEHGYAYYIVTPDDFQSALQVKMICENARWGRCQNTWTLPPTSKIENFRIIQTEQT